MTTPNLINITHFEVLARILAEYNYLQYAVKKSWVKFWNFVIFVHFDSYKLHLFFGKYILSQNTFPFKIGITNDDIKNWLILICHWSQRKYFILQSMLYSIYSKLINHKKKKSHLH